MYSVTAIDEQPCDKSFQMCDACWGGKNLKGHENIFRRSGKI